MKKRVIALFLCAALLCAMVPAAQAWKSLSWISARFSYSPAVYSGPGTSYYRANNGKAQYGGNGQARVYGKAPNGWLMIGYQLSSGDYRIGYIEKNAIDKMYEASKNDVKTLSFDNYAAYINTDTSITDDPVINMKEVCKLSRNTQCTYLAAYDDWTYIEVNTYLGTMRGFVPSWAVTVTSVKTATPTANPWWVTPTPTAKPWWVTNTPTAKPWWVTNTPTPTPTVKPWWVTNTPTPTPTAKPWWVTNTPTPKRKTPTPTPKRKTPTPTVKWRTPTPTPKATKVPTGMTNIFSYKTGNFTRNYDVYLGPGYEYPRSGNGKTVLGKGGAARVYGTDGDWLMIGYETSDGKYRIGYITDYDLPEGISSKTVKEMYYEFTLCYTTSRTLVTDDPVIKMDAIEYIPEDTEVYFLGWASNKKRYCMIEYYSPTYDCYVRGFCKGSSLKMVSK